MMRAQISHKREGMCDSLCAGCQELMLTGDEA